AGAGILAAKWGQTTLLRPGSSASFKVAPIATICMGVLDIEYNLLMYSKTNDYISKTQYGLAAVSADINMAVSLCGLQGMLVQGAWTATVLVRRKPPA
ncbi:MAG: hypothetical protein MUP97_13385, partial [Acidimicrobiia bacterium]|nr:hypothetical protein [Acidimicrobiia bacterium]